MSALTCEARLANLRAVDDPTRDQVVAEIRAALKGAL